jgi:hypothetical protein
VSFAAITPRVASQQVFIVVVYFVIDSVRKLLDTPSYVCNSLLLIFQNTAVTTNANRSEHTAVVFPIFLSVGTTQLQSN